MYSVSRETFCGGGFVHTNIGVRDEETKTGAKAYGEAAEDQAAAGFGG
jgi:hypothetical protein